jgi:hypothetical protein
VRLRPLPGAELDYATKISRRKRSVTAKELHVSKRAIAALCI